MPKQDYYLPERQLVSQADQSFIESANVPRSRFTGSKTRLTTFDAGLIYPFHVEEVLPGDHLKYQVSAYIRTATPLFPLMSNQRCDFHWFFIPNRLVWVDFVRMMGEQSSPSDSIAFTVPQLVSTGNGFAVGGVGDHFGLPCVGQAAAQLSVSALPFRGYNLVWSQWYRDENLVNGAPVQTLVTEAACPLRRRAKSHDYFTSALPWPQKFTAPAALGATAPIHGLGVAFPAPAVGGSINVTETPNSIFIGGLGTYTNSFDATAPFYMQATSLGVPQIFADLSAISVNTLRQSFMVQQLLERDARGGTRYTEIVLSHFGVRSPDARLQRTEYIGGSSVEIATTPIAQTAPTTGVPLGALGGTGAAFGGGAVSYAATEHGYILGLMSVKSELAYQQGIPRHFSRLTRLDYYWPSLAQLGEQAILRKEIYATGVPANDDVVFGYQGRFDEYRQMYSDVTGLFRSTSAGAIDQWHTVQEFGVAPVLGQTFIEDTPPMDRVLAAGALEVGKQYIANIVIRRDAVRPMPTFGTPALLGRF